MTMIAAVLVAAVAQTSPLVGVWEGKQEGRGAVELKINADGTATFAGEALIWKIAKSKLVIVDSKADVQKYDYQLEGDALTLSGGDLSTPLSLKRKGATPPAAVPAAAEVPKSVAIAGSWEGGPAADPIRLDLKADGTGTLNSAAIRWTFAGERLTISAEKTGKSLDFGAALAGDTLTLSGGGLPQAIPLKRVAEGPDPRLVGRWQTEAGTGFELKADGTAANASGAFKYATSSGRLYCSIGGSVLSSAYAVEGDRLELTDQGRTVTLRKVAESKAFAAAARGNERNVVVNGQKLTDDVVRQMEQAFRVRVYDGAYWYDPLCGAWGVQGGPGVGFLPAGLKIGGPLRADASNGNSGVFINGRQLHANDVAALQQIVAVQLGRYWVDAAGNAGYEGNPTPIVNLVQAAQRARSGSGGKSWSHSNFYTGISAGGDGQTTYVMGKDFSVIVGP